MPPTLIIEGCKSMFLLVYKILLQKIMKEQTLKSQQIVFHDLSSHESFIKAIIFKDYNPTISSYQTQINDEASQYLQDIASIQSWPCIILHYKNNKIESNPLKYIKNVSFPSLKMLSLYNCGTETIEPIVRAKIPHLTKLFLVNNRLIGLEPLHKIESQNIENLSFGGNAIKETRTLEKGNWPNITDISIEFEEDHKEQCICKKFLAKLQFSKSKSNMVFIDCQERILDYPLIHALRKKMNRLKIWTKDGALGN